MSSTMADKLSYLAQTKGLRICATVFALVNLWHIVNLTAIWAG